MTWGEFELAAPELARRGRERLDAAGLALLGTIRRDGSPRISPVEPFFAEGRLLLGVMARSAKARDLAADPRCVLHSVVSEPNAGVPELKLFGRVEDVERSVRDAVDAWWTGRPLDDARVVSLWIDEAVYVSWEIAAARMTVARWTRQTGVEETTRGYP